jgi:hypothetical protein
MFASDNNTTSNDDNNPIFFCTPPSSILISDFVLGIFEPTAANQYGTIGDNNNDYLIKFIDDDNKL